MKTFHLLTTRTTLNSQKAFLSQNSQVLLQQGGKLREDKRQGPRPPWVPFRVSVGVGPGEWRHSMAEDDVGIVEHLLHLHGPVGAPAHVVP